MADDPRLVELLKFYKKKGAVKRPEVGILTGKSVGQIAGTCNRASITGWPKFEDQDVLEKRPCQFPILRNGKRHVCGKERVEGDPLCCSEHHGKIWDPDEEEVGTASEPVKPAPAEAELVELLKFYRKKAAVTVPDVSILTGIALGRLTEVCQQHDLLPWPDIPFNIARDRPCQFPILKRTERYVCGLMRSAGVDADPLRCGEHREMVWDPATEL